MEIRGKKWLVLYMEDWQRRLIEDALGIKDCFTWNVPVGGSGSGFRYGVGVPQNPKVKRMYLTEWQMREVSHETGEACEYVELVPSQVVRYGVPPDGFGQQ
jgi:hypothetical protein